MIDGVRDFLDINETLRRFLTVASLLGVLGIGTVLKRLTADLHPKILRLELAARAEEVDLVMRSWGAAGRKRAALVLSIDYLFAICAGVFLGFVAWGGSTHIFFEGGWWSDLRSGRMLCLLLAMLMTSFDVLENSGALLMIAGVRRYIPRATAIFTGGKVVSGVLAMLYPLVVLMRVELDVVGHGWDRAWPLFDASQRWASAAMVTLYDGTAAFLRTLFA